MNSKNKQSRQRGGWALEPEEGSRVSFLVHDSGDPLLMEPVFRPQQAGQKWCPVHQSSCQRPLSSTGGSRGWRS